MDQSLTIRIDAELPIAAEVAVPDVGFGDRRVADALTLAWLVCEIDATWPTPPEKPCNDAVLPMAAAVTVTSPIESVSTSRLAWICAPSSESLPDERTV